ncbi:hypothetical protein GON01_05460 [Sphingomonas sp. MAH-20]|uniref:Uncharacterized protein n=1 Tax=Sphingomonas horti TaxID=2682842 RepID=A0A6I4IZ02_9SPHN|nr:MULTISPECIES: hypothetical protein [Sphingomonas]MBA2918418.1 hypothetical protein [Sphingomonas sp. CGMCC 1.13658]MVO77385.1 hypothetical protein [Sphingomonas horti]
MLLLLAACGGSGKDRIAQRVEDDAENRAAAMEQASETMTNALRANATQQQANIVRSAGEDRAEAIRESDLDAGALTQQQKNAIVAGRSTGTQTPRPR